MKNYFKLFLVTGLLAIQSSCIKEEFDAPPTGGEDPVVSGTRISIAALKATYVPNSFTQVPNDVYIVGIVIADDQSGNFYKEIILQDSTGGISVLIDQSDYYTDFPVGRKVFVKCQGLFLNDYNELIQLGGYIDYSGSYPSLGRIPLSLVSKYLLKGTYYNTVTPKTVTLATITSAPQNTLIKINDVQFICGNAAPVTWADAIAQEDKNRTLIDCIDSTLIVRSSGYSSFAGIPTPYGKGSIIGVLQIFGTDLQLKIRDLNDVGMDGPRCNMPTDVCVYNNVSGFITIDSVRKLFSFPISFIPAGKVIKGVVISDKVYENINWQNIFIQDSTGGILVRFSNPHNFSLGDLVSINVGGMELSEYQTLLEVNNVPLGNATLAGTCVEVPWTVTISTILSAPETYEGRLVLINNATLSGTGTSWSELNTIADGTGSLPFYTSGGAIFIDDPVPALTGNIIAIVSAYGGQPEIIVRNPCDLH